MMIKIHNLQKRYVWIIFILSFLIFSIGCNNDDDPSGSDDTPPSSQSETGNQAPDIPPASTFVMAFDDFQTDSSQYHLNSIDRIEPRASRTNWGNAVLQVTFWNTLLKAGMAVPVATFLESFKHTPVKQDDNSWDWSYSVDIENISYTAKLNGKIVDDEVEWNMYITKQGYFSDFNWYSGKSMLAATSGSWTIKKSPDNPVDLLRIEWARDASSNTGDIKYTNIEGTSDEYGGYIYYGLQTADTFDAFYNIYYKSKENLVNIEWNRATKAGRIKNEQYFNDTAWHYWDENFYNIEGSI